MSLVERVQGFTLQELIKAMIIVGGGGVITGVGIRVGTSLFDLILGSEPDSGEN